MRCGRRQFLRAAASLLGTPLLLRGQQDLPTFSTDVKVVNVLATVTDKKGEIIRDLTKDDFVLYEDKRPQTVRYFAQQSDLPLTIGLMVDTSMSQRRVLDAERGASFRFLEVVLRPSKDHVFLMQFDFRIFVRQELTSSLKELDDALAFVETPTRSQLQIQSGGGTLMFDAVVQATRDVMEKQQGRKALILLTDGVDTGSETNVAGAIEAAQRADTLIYSILFADAGAYGFGGADGRRPLQRMAQETGGSFFEVSKKQSIDQIYAIIQEELRSQYSLGYVSDLPVRLSEFRKIEVTTKRKGLVVQSRDRYYARR
ncbi:MAG TPA: VWA domain-containing protein [Candidatus Acidoferrum sp.]|jgi:VWFA-related protein|nr:VWA domain-containing protein [Candidatus Acidoferrum sp.]